MLFRSIRARGGFELDVTWRGGILQEAVLRGTPGRVAQVRYRDALSRVRIGKDGSARLLASQLP